MPQLICGEQQHTALHGRKPRERAIETGRDIPLQLRRGPDCTLEQEIEIRRVQLLESLGLGEMLRDGTGIRFRELPLIQPLQGELPRATAATPAHQAPS